MEEAPRQATAAQMAKRKIASLKGRPKARSASPMVNSNTFNAPDVSFGGSNAFNFGGQQQQQAPAFGGGNTSFTFGQSQPQQNGGNTPTFQFGQSQQSTPEPSNPFSGFGQQQQAPPMPNGGAQSNPFAGFGQQPQQPQQNGTAPSNPFNFGQQQPAQPQQNGAGSSSTFTFGQQAQQPQQNGTAPSNPFAGFGQQNNAASSNTFTFGQNQSSQPAQQNGTSSNIFGGFGQQKAQEAQTNGTPAPSNPFANFGQSQSTQPAVNGTSQTPSFGGFGQSQSQQPGTPAPSTAPTDADMSKKPSDTQKAPDNLFQPATTPSLFSKPADTPKPDSSNLFSSAGSQSIFSKPAETPKPASSNLFFTPSASSTLFGSKPAETPKPASSNLFSSAGNQSLFSKPAETPKPASSNLFTSAASQSTADKPAEAPKMDGWAAFKSGSPSAATTNGNSAAASGGDSVFSGWQKEQATKSFTPFTASQAAQPGDDEDEETTENPEKPAQSAFSGASTLFGGPAATPKPAAGGDLFSRINKPDVQESAPSAGSTTPAAPAPGRSLFDRVSFPDKSQDQPQVSQTPAPQASNLFGGFKPQAPPATVPPKSLFQPSQNLFGAPATPTPAASKPSDAPKPLQSSLFAKSTASAPSQQSTVAGSGNNDPISKQLRKLNEGLLAHLNKSSVQADYTQVCEYYIAQAKRIKGESTAAQRSEAPVHKSALASTPASSTNIFGAASSAKSQPQPATQSGSKRLLDDTRPAESPQKRQAVNNSTNLFQSAQQTPKATSALARPPATEPSKLFGKRAAEDEAENDAPGKRRRSNEAIEYPKLPENASNTAKLFEAALNKPTAGAASKPAAEKPQAPGGFKPTMPTPSASAGGFKPSAPAGGSTNFLAAFGQNAQKEQADARKKARDEDFDSEDDDPEEWEKNYAAEQERKRAKIAEAAKAGSGFTFAAPAAASSAASVFGGFGAKSPAKPADKEPAEPEKTPATPATAKPSEAPATGSLFSKSTFNPSASLSTFGTKPADAEKGKDVGENKDSADEDHTWKQGTPIKFGGASDSTTPAVPATAPPKGNSLFNNTAGNSLFSGAGSKPAFSFSNSTSGAAPTGGSSLFNLSKPAAPSAGFSFSPAKPAEPATEKPSTEAEKPEEGGDDDAAPAEPQVEDMTALQPSELEEADVLYHVEKAKCYKLEAKNEGGAKAWTEKGLGKIWLLKNKETGKTRVLLKVAPFGKPAMNFGLRADEKYEISAKKVMGGFIDHIHEKTPKAPSRWYVAFGREEDAKEMARIMQEEAAK